MIDLGLSKLAIIGVVALIVIGPEKLPKVARMLGTLYGRAQRYISQVKSDVGRELDLEEMRRLQQEVQSAAESFEQDVKQEVSQVEAELGQVNNEFNDFWTPPVTERGVPTPQQVAAKAKDFRRKKLLRTSSVPQWYKNRSGTRSRVISGAARVAKYRKKSPFSFY
jgi:sec-independent protein translocase protein TatB